MLGKLLKIYLFKNTKAIVLFSLFKLGWVNTTKEGFKGRSIVFGIWRFEFQFNLSYITNITLAKTFAKA